MEADARGAREAPREGAGRENAPLGLLAVATDRVGDERLDAVRVEPQRLGERAPGGDRRPSRCNAIPCSRRPRTLRSASSAASCAVAVSPSTR